MFTKVQKALVNVAQFLIHIFLAYSALLDDLAVSFVANNTLNEATQK